MVCSGNRFVRRERRDLVSKTEQGSRTGSGILVAAALVVLVVGDGGEDIGAGG